MIHVPTPVPYRPRLLPRIWEEYFAAPQDPHEKIKQEDRDAVAKDASDEHFREGAELLQQRYADRDVTVSRMQEVNSFTFNGIAALFVMIGAGMMATVAFFSPMGLLLLPSLFLAGYSVNCFLKGNEPADDQVHPTYIEDEYVKVLEHVKTDRGEEKRYEERAKRSMKQRKRLWVNCVWARRGSRMMRACIVSLLLELTTFSILIVVF